MSYLIAAAGTGGHVFPGLAVGEALVDAGVGRDEILYVGGGRLEAEVYPEAGFPFLQLELRGLQRRLTLENLAIPRIVWGAARRIRAAIDERGVRAVLGMGGYVTVPTAYAARSAAVPLFIHEQNAEAGLANRLAARWADEVFGSFPRTAGLPGATWVGNPVRKELATFSRPALRTEALRRYGLEPGPVVVGVFGGSLGAGAINDAVVEMIRGWRGPDIAVVHLAGRAHADRMRPFAEASPLPWVVVDFETRMDLFYAASDLVIARAGGAVAELTVTSTPAVLVPGGFGSGAHQLANARVLADAGAAEVVPQDRLDRLGEVVGALVADPARRRAMAEAARTLARPDAADRIARRLREAHDAG